MAAACRDDTRRDSAAETKGVADSDHPIADTRLVIGKLDIWRIISIHFEQCQVRKGSAPTTLAG
jgi:hypothetical protein